MYPQYKSYWNFKKFYFHSIFSIFSGLLSSDSYPGRLITMSTSNSHVVKSNFIIMQ